MSSRYLQGLPQREPAAEIPKIPAECSVEGCARRTAIAFVHGSKDGRFFTSNGGEFLATREANGGVVYVERPGCHFDDWITRCAVCYERDLYRAGKCQSQQESGVES